MNSRRLAMIVGATNDFGRALSTQIVANHVDLILIDSSSKDLSELIKHLKVQTNALIKGICLDSGSLTEIQQLSRELEPILQQIDFLICNEDITLGPNPLNLKASGKREQLIDINIKGLLFIIRAVVPFMVKRNFGHIITVGAKNSENSKHDIIYHVTKQATQAISETLRMDAFGTSVKVTHIKPNNSRPEDFAEAAVWALSQPPHVNIHELVLSSK